MNWEGKHPIDVAKDIVDMMEILNYDDKIVFMKNIIEGIIQEASLYEINKIQKS